MPDGHASTDSDWPHEGHWRQERIIVPLAAVVCLRVELASLHAAEIARTALVLRPLSFATLPRELRRGVAGLHVNRVVLARVRRRRVSRVVWRAERGLGGRS